ncbi:hypothetical protein B0H14DRAFT_3900161 [Mycena olivaceomarginata]|nr:hypothetical protein B0H14DRAFT_3900161 [Mycena olivaceomarginata]
MLAPCLGGLSFQPTKSDAVECDRLCNRLTTISFKKRSCEPLRDLPSSFYSGGRPVSLRLSVIHWAPPSVMPRVCIVSSPLVPLFSWDAPPRTEAHASIRCLVYPHCTEAAPSFRSHLGPPAPGNLLRPNSQCSLNPRRDPHPRLLMPIPSVFLQGRLVSSFIIPHLHLQVPDPHLFSAQWYISTTTVTPSVSRPLPTPLSSASNLLASRPAFPASSVPCTLSSLLSSRS